MSKYQVTRVWFVEAENSTQAIVKAKKIPAAHVYSSLWKRIKFEGNKNEKH